MSDDEENLAVGRMIMEYRRAKDALTITEDELRHLGERLHAVATAASKGNEEADFSVLADPDRPLSLMREANSLRDRKLNLGAKLKSLGVSID